MPGEVGDLQAQEVALAALVVHNTENFLFLATCVTGVALGLEGLMSQFTAAGAERTQGGSRDCVNP